MLDFTREPRLHPGDLDGAQLLRLRPICDEFAPVVNEPFFCEAGCVRRPARTPRPPRVGVARRSAIGLVGSFPPWGDPPDVWPPVGEPAADWDVSDLFRAPAAPGDEGARIAPHLLTGRCPWRDRVQQIAAEERREVVWWPVSWSSDDTGMRKFSATGGADVRGTYHASEAL